jgi:putative thiamine transport system permease protein
MVVLFFVPLLASLALLVPLFADAAAFAAFFDHPQMWGATRLTLFSACTSTLVSLALACLLARTSAPHHQAVTGAMMAVPHLALALGLAFLVMPSGWLVRLVAAAFWNVDTPPQWVTVQDPQAIALTIALILKETPFLLWVLLSLMQRDDVRQQLGAEMRAARSLGHGAHSVWLRVALPQLLPRMVWPLVAVFAYGMTVVDMALAIGPTQPPTLATLIWRDLNDADLVTNARGAAGVLVLTGLIAFVLALVAGVLRATQSVQRRLWSAGPRKDVLNLPVAATIRGVATVVYVLVVVVLLVQSLAGPWPFPQLLPDEISPKAWARLLSESHAAVLSLLLALATSVTSLAICLVWFETTSPRHDRVLLSISALALCLPPLLLALGEYRLLLLLGQTGTIGALFMVHLLPVMAYIVVMLHGPYRGYDPRWRAVSAGLGISTPRHLTRIKWPALKAPILSALSVGFAVSTAQFVPAQLAAAGRYSTLPMETVSLSSGSNRPLIAAAALMLALMPLVAFILAGMFGRPRFGRR